MTGIATQRDLSDEHEADLIRSELALSLTFSVLAALKYKDGDQQSAKESIVHADEASSTVFEFLSTPNLYKRLTNQVVWELMLEAEGVKQRLRALRRNSSNRTVV